MPFKKMSCIDIKLKESPSSLDHYAMMTLVITY